MTRAALPLVAALAVQTLRQCLRRKVLWVLLLDRLGPVIRRPNVRAWMERATGAVLVGMGVRLALAR